nr:transposase [Agrobacterium pusense]
MARGDLTDMEWRIIGRLLPTERGRKSRPAHDNRRYINGMLHVLRVGCPWRDMHERYGDGQGRPLGFILTGGEASDYNAVPALLALPAGKPKLFLADKGYDGDSFARNC